MPTTALDLNRLLSQGIGDWRQIQTSIKLTNTNTHIIASGLNEYDGGADGYLEDWWAYVTDKNNAGVERRIRNYYTSNYTANVFGSAWTTDADQANIRLGRHSYGDKQVAINAAVEEIYPSIFKPIELTELVTESSLPNGHFRDWASNAAVPLKYSLNGVTAANTSTGGLFRGGSCSAKLTATATNGHMSVSSNVYPPLLDLQGATVSFKAWVYPEDANDGSVGLYTRKADGTEQEIYSTTSNPAGAYSLLSLEDQALNDGLVEVQIRFKVKTDTKYAFFDNARVTGYDQRRYLLPKDFDDGVVSRVFLQGEGSSEDWCDDIQPRDWDEVTGWHIDDDGTDKYLVLPAYYSSNRLIRLVGRRPLEKVSASTDVVSVDGKELDMLVAMAKYKLFQGQGGDASSEDQSRYDRLASDAYSEYMRLKMRQGMMKSPSKMNYRTY